MKHIICIQYDSVVKYVDKNALNYNYYQLLVSIVTPPSMTAIVGEDKTKHQLTDNIDWIQVFKGKNH